MAGPEMSTGPIEETYTLFHPKSIQNKRKHHESVDIGADIPRDAERLYGVPREMTGWDVYNNEAKKVDTELVNDWRESLNSLLLFVSFCFPIKFKFFTHFRRPSLQQS